MRNDSPLGSLVHPLDNHDGPTANNWIRMCSSYSGSHHFKDMDHCSRPLQNWKFDQKK